MIYITGDTHCPDDIHRLYDKIYLKGCVKDEKKNNYKRTDK